jgi:hypothetical protein
MFCRKSKYRNVKTEVNGIKFDSRREADKWRELEILRRSGILISVERQVAFLIIHNGVKICKYVADFVTVNRQGVKVVIDVKGFKTPVYRLKKKLVRAFYGIEIEEC